MVNLVAVDVVEISVLPRARIDIQPYVDGVALMDVELRDAVSAKDAEHAGTSLLVLGLDDKLLRLPSVAGCLGYALLSRVFLDDDTLNLYSL